MNTITVPGKTTSIGVQLVPSRPKVAAKQPCTYSTTCDVSGFNNPVWNYTDGENTGTLQMDAWSWYGRADIVIKAGDCEFTVVVSIEGYACQ